MNAPAEPAVNPDSPGTPDRWLMLSLVAVNYFVLYLHRNLLNYIQPPLKADLNLTDFDLGILRSAWLVPYCLVQIRVGFLADRHRRRTVILASLLASVVALAGMGLARSFEDFFYLRILLALAQSCAVPAMASTIADCFTPRTRSRAVGLYLFSYNVALVVAGKYGGKVADVEVWRIPLGEFGSGAIEVAGWRMAHFVFAAVGGLAALVLFALFREPERTERQAGVGLGTEGAEAWRTVGVCFRIPSFVAIALVFALTGVAITSLQFWLARYFHDDFKMSNEQAGEFATVWIQAGTMAGLIIGGLWGDYWAKLAIRGRTAVQSAGIVAMLPSLWVIGTGESRPLLAVSMAVFGFGVGLYQANLWTSTFEVVDPAARATAVGLLNLTSGVLVLSWADPAIGWVHEKGISLGTIIAGMSLFIAAALALMLLNMKFLLPAAYRGPLRPQNGETMQP